VQNTKKKLLSITNLKKYFPIAKSSLFQKERLYVRANEDISIDIYEGETFGLVGESGCGKSTLGRVILQLYEQTAGSTLYYGRSRAEVAPAYVKKTFKNPEKYLKIYREAQAKADKTAALIEELGDNATFYQIQDNNLAQAAAKSALMNVAKILGGLISLPTAEMKEGANILLRQHYVLVKIEKINAKIKSVENSIDLKLNKLSTDENERTEEKTEKDEKSVDRTP
jgi:peptide/nickel transport system ATP-binding protein